MKGRGENGLELKSRTVLALERESKPGAGIASETQLETNRSFPRASVISVVRFPFQACNRLAGVR